MKKILNLLAVSFAVLTIFSACDKKSPDGNSTTKPSNNTVVNSNKAIVVNSANQSNSASVPGNANKSAAQANPDLNAANFDKLQTGMAYKDVVKILGAEGEVMDGYGFDNNKTVMYKWNGTDGSFAKIIFQNGKLLDKVQTGLR